VDAEAVTTVRTKAATVRTDERMNLRMIASPLNEPDGAGSWARHTSPSPKRQVNWQSIPRDSLDMSLSVTGGVSVPAAALAEGSPALVEVDRPGTLVL
jgi:hypothetical protein